LVYWYLMTNKNKYRISIIAFALATYYMFYVQGVVFQKGMSGGIDGWDIFQTILSYVLLITAIVFYIVYRSKKP